MNRLTTSTLLTAVMAIALTAASANAAVITLAEYKFDSSSTASSDGDVQTTASAITIGVGSIATSTATAMPNPPLVKIAADQTGATGGSGNTMAEAIGDGDWLTFSIDTNGAPVDFDALSVLIGGNDVFGNMSDPTPGAFANVYTSAQVGSVLESGEASSDLGFVGFKSVSQGSNNFDAETQTVDMSSIQGFNGTITFWLVFEDDASTASRFLEVDDITVTGTVIPEPATLALLGLGGLMMVGRRRRRA